MRLILFCSGAFWLLFTSSCMGAAYYFDATQGDDNNAGTGPEDPWKTIAKFNATKFSPGDKIYLKRGETWNSDRFYLHTSGTPDQVITLMAYGTGARPVLLSIVSGARTGTADYWTVKDVSVTTGNKFACIDVVGFAANLTIKDSVIHGCTGRGISVQSVASGDVDNLLIQDVIVYDNGRQGIHVSDYTGANNIKGVLIQRVTAYGNGINGPNNLDGINVGGLEGGIVQYCKSYNNNGDGIDLGGKSTNSFVQYNLAYKNTGTGIVTSNTADNTLLIGNVSHHNGLSGLHIKNPTSNCKAYNNTLVYNDIYGAQLFTTNSVTFMNNIVAYNKSGTSTPINYFTRASKQTLISDYNLFWHPIYPPSQFYDYDKQALYDFVQWQSLGYDTHSLNVMPDLDENYIPKSGSPAIDSGTDLGKSYSAILNPASSWTDNVSVLNQGDFGAWDIGAYIGKVP